MRRALAAVLLAALAGCGGGGDRLVVSAASSLTEPLTECSRGFDGADVKLSFAGSDQLAAQIRHGVRPDVFAAANTRLPGELAREGLLERPVRFVTNELVIAVPSGSRRVAGVRDLAAPGLALVAGAEAVPVGDYTREVLSRLPARTGHAILANVRSEEPDVKGVVGKLLRGAGDAGFVYRTDIVDGLEAIALPPGLRPTVAYAAAVVRGAPHPELARRYLDGLTGGRCAEALERAGFGPPVR